MNAQEANAHANTQTHAHRAPRPAQAAATTIRALDRFIRPSDEAINITAPLQLASTGMHCTAPMRREGLSTRATLTERRTVAAS